MFLFICAFAVCSCLCCDLHPNASSPVFFNNKKNHRTAFRRLDMLIILIKYVDEMNIISEFDSEVLAEIIVKCVGERYEEKTKRN